MSTKLEELENKLKDIKSQISNIASTALIEVFEELFKTYPLLQSVSWEQYTPYFNDGDACVFQVDWDYPSISITLDHNEDSDLFDCDEMDDYVDEYGLDADELHDIFDRLRDILSVDDNLLLTAFGDHVQVRIDRDLDVEVFGYSHD